MNTDLTTKYAVTMEVDPSFSPFTLGTLIAEAMATLPDEPFDYSFDPYWDGSPRLVLPLIYKAPGLKDTEVGRLTITAPNAVECFSCPEIFFTKEEMRVHARHNHVVTMRMIPTAVPGEPSGFICPEADCGEVFDTEQGYWSHWGAKH